MFEEEQERSTSNTVYFARWAIGTILVLMAIIEFVVGSYFAGLIFVVLAFVVVPKNSGENSSKLDEPSNNKKIDVPIKPATVPEPELNRKQEETYKEEIVDDETINELNKKEIEPFSTVVMATKHDVIVTEEEKIPEKELEKDIMAELLIEIDNELKNEHKISYQSGIRTLIVDLNETSLWGVEFLKSEIFEDTLKIIQIATKSQNKIMVVLVNYSTTLTDDNNNSAVRKVYSGRYPMENFYTTNWDSIKKDQVEDWLWENADYFWLHKILKSNH